MINLGLDLDNTIICYDEVFNGAAKSMGLVEKEWFGNKTDLKTRFLEQPDGLEVWKRLQGQVYGKLMVHARLSPGVKWFLKRCRMRGVNIAIVSHKTRHGHYDAEKLPLREIAFAWLTSRGVFDPDQCGINIENVYFEDTRKEKIKRIRELGVTHFVDDLPEIFDDPEFPCGVEKILFCPMGQNNQSSCGTRAYVDWQEIGYSLFGYECSTEWKLLASGLTGKDVTRCGVAVSGGNSHVHRIEMRGEELMALKRYPVDLKHFRGRLNVEAMSCQFLHAHEVTVVPGFKGSDEDANVGLYEWIDGIEVTEYSEADLRQLIEFIEDVDRIRLCSGSEKLGSAAEACLSGTELLSQIINRRANLAAENVPNEKLNGFLEREFDPLCERVFDQYRRSFYAGVGFDDILPRDHWTLSPSDFGFHNALRQSDGKIRILDLEYFGWDDPVKLISDFLWHPAMELSDSLKSVWLEEMLRVFRRDTNILRRINAAHPMYGLRWILISLNIFSKTHGGVLEKSEENCRRQLLKSRSLCRDVTEWMDSEVHFPYLGT